MKDSKNYYEILGVSPRSEQEVIRAAYKAMMRKYHPDTSQSPDTAERAKEINEAFSVLNDPDRRLAYDELCNEDHPRSEATHPPQPPTPPREAATSSSPSQERDDDANRKGWRPVAGIALGIISLMALVSFTSSRHSGDSDLLDREAVVNTTEESVELVAERVAKSDLRPMPGSWKSEMSILSIDVPGLKDETKEMMKSQMGKANTSFRCLTREEAERGTGEFFKPRDQSDCIYHWFSMADGKINAEMTCNDGAMKQYMRMSGTYDEESYAVIIGADGMVEGQPTSIEMSIQSRRVGECVGN